MALLGLTTYNDFPSTIRYNARDGLFNRADRVLDSAGNYTNSLTDVTEAICKLGLLIDVGGIEIGWIRFEDGVDIRTQHHTLGRPGPQPSSLHKEGIRLEAWLPQEISDGDSRREFTHTSRAVIDSVNRLHTAWEAAVAADDIDESQVPHVSVVIEPVRTKHGTFRKPVFALREFVPRPTEWAVKPIAPAAPQVPDLGPDLGSFGKEPPASNLDDDAPIPF